MSDDETPWLDLEELDIIGQSRHPLNARRLQDSPYAQEVAYFVTHPTTRPPRAYRQHPQGTSLKNMAVWAEHALMIRLWVRRPLRQRNMRELGLFRGTWNGVAVNQNLIPQAGWDLSDAFRGRGVEAGSAPASANVSCERINGMNPFRAVSSRNCKNG